MARQANTHGKTEAVSISVITKMRKVLVMAGINLKPIARRKMTFAIRGTSPLIMHQWSEKAKREMREKQQEGKKTKTREKRVPADEAKAATYTTDDGQIGIPGMAFKSALVTAAHKDIGIEKTLVRKALFLVTDDPNKVLPIHCSEPTVREDMVRVGMGSADQRRAASMGGSRSTRRLRLRLKSS